MIISILLNVLGPIILIALIIIFALRWKKKKEATRKAHQKSEPIQKSNDFNVASTREEKAKQVNLVFLEQQATELCNVQLPKNYFINLFMGWLDDTEENRVKAFYENKETLRTMTPEAMEGLPERFATSDVGAMFLETEEEWNKFTADKTQEDIDDIISGEIFVTLGLYPILKDYIQVYSQADFYFAKPARDYFKILFAMQLYANNKESVSKTELMKSADIQVRALEDFQKLKWKEIKQCLIQQSK